MESSEDKLLRIEMNGEMIDQYKIRNMIEKDDQGQSTTAIVHVYIPNPFSQEVGQEYYRLASITQVLTLPINVTHVQLIVRNQQYYFKLSTSTKYSTTLSKDDLKYFSAYINQDYHDEIRKKEKCSCNFCKFPLIKDCEQ